MADETISENQPETAITTDKDLPLPSSPVIENPWRTLRQFTPARIALGRTGHSLPTSALLDFQLAHARARDAVYTEFQPALLSSQLEEAGYPSIQVHSQAPDRKSFLQRPDLGRRLSPG